METVLRVYARPYDPRRPVVCYDERPCFLIGDVIIPLPMTTGKSQREDYEYTKNGSCSVLMAFEPHTGRRWAEVYSQRTSKEYTGFMVRLANEFPSVDQITLIQDNLNTHHAGSFYKHLDIEAAEALKRRFEWLFTPKHASWLNMVEIELSALSRQCLNRRIPDQACLEREVVTWIKDRNRKKIMVNWHFMVDRCREKMSRHYKGIRI